MDIFKRDESEVQSPSAGLEKNVSSTEAEFSHYEIIDFTAQFPGWFAIYDDPENPGTNSVIMRPVCGFARVELSNEKNERVKAMRHLAADAEGEIADVEDFDGFLCVVGPGQNPGPIVARVRRDRSNNGEAPSPSQIIMP